MNRAFQVAFARALFCAITLVWAAPFVFSQEPVYIPPKKKNPAAQESADLTPAPDPQPATADPQPIFFPPLKKVTEQSADPAHPLKMQDTQPDADQIQVVPDVDPAQPVAIDLTRSIKKQLDDAVVPALMEQRDFDFVQAMGKLIARLDKSALNSVEQYVQAQGVSIRERFVSLLSRAIERQETVPIPDLKIDVVEFINAGLREHVESELTELDQHLVMNEQPQLPDDWRDSEQLFWEVHVWKNRMTNVGRVSEYGVTIQQKNLDRAQKRQDTPMVNLLQPTVMLHNKVQQRYRKMIEGETVLRIAELEKAEKTLRENADFEQRISAAFALELHGDALSKMFAEYPSGSFLRPELNDPKLPERCSEWLASGRDAGKDVVEKAMLLRRGAHWWLRGRYGAGPEAFGLLKSKKALESAEAMFGLYMPKERPDPVGAVSSDNSIAPGYERRHYYTWAVEKRDLVTSSSRRAAGIQETTIGQVIGEVSEQTSFW